jgi:hypothetical protein
VLFLLQYAAPGSQAAAILGWTSIEVHALCCCAGVVKHVRHVRVFVTTGIISLWAYVWMLVVYLWWTPSEVRPQQQHILQWITCVL